MTPLCDLFNSSIGEGVWSESLMVELPLFDWTISGEFESVDKVHENIQVESVQIDNGVPFLEFRTIIFDDLIVLLDSESLGSVNDYRVEPDMTLIALFQMRSPAVRWCGQEIESDAVLINASGRDYIVGLPAGYKGIHIQIKNTLIAKLGLLPEEFMTPGSISPDWAIPVGPQGSALRRWLFALFSSPEDLRLLTQNAAAAIFFRDRLLGELGVMFDETLNGDIKLGTSRANGRYGLARRAQDLITDRLHEPISVEDLASELGVSRATLWHIFRDVFEISPHRYVLNRKLQAVRQELRDRSARRGSVAEIAEQFGFTDISRFGQFYKRMYGEVPSSTLGGSEERLGSIY